MPEISLLVLRMYNGSGIASSENDGMCIADDVGFGIYVWLVDVRLECICQHILSIAATSVDSRGYIVPSKLTKLLKFSCSLAETGDKSVDPGMTNQWKHIRNLSTPGSSER